MGQEKWREYAKLLKKNRCLVTMFLMQTIKPNDVFLPNLQHRKFWSEGQNRWISLRLSNAALRTIDKNGIDSVLAKLRSDK